MSKIDEAELNSEYMECDFSSFMNHIKFNCSKNEHLNEC